MGRRYGSCAVALSPSPGEVQVVVFGGVAHWPPTFSTVVLHFGKKPLFEYYSIYYITIILSLPDTQVFFSA